MKSAHPALLLLTLGRASGCASSTVIKPPPQPGINTGQTVEAAADAGDAGTRNLQDQKQRTEKRQGQF